MKRSSDRETLRLEIEVPKIDLRSILALLTVVLVVGAGTPIAAPSIAAAVATASANIADDLNDTTAEIGGSFEHCFALIRRIGDTYLESYVNILKRRMAGEDARGARHASWVIAMLEDRFTPGWDDRAQAIAAYERHNEDVRAHADPDRLLEWRAGDGWAPICAALGVGVPDEEFPHENTTADFHARTRETAR